MKLVVTGGGTGGHLYPALEIAELARRRGATVVYAGSLRGPEQAVSTSHNFPFRGFHSAPLYSLKQPRGWRSLFLLLRATKEAKVYLREEAPNAVFGTGGYGAAPLMAAARSLGIPLAMHESNSVPGRSNRLFANYAKSITCTFKTTVSVLPKAVRTGQPIRAELREAASAVRRAERPGGHMILALGGSQGSVFLNRIVKETSSSRQNPYEWLLAAGKSHLQLTGNERLTSVPYLETPQLAEAYRSASVVVGRSGGTLAEFAMFGLPSILVPLPTSADNHQARNAEEFVQLNAAVSIKERDVTVKVLLEAISNWIENPSRCEAARAALREWDMPQATETITDLVMAAAS